MAVEDLAGGLDGDPVEELEEVVDGLQLAEEGHRGQSAKIYYTNIRHT